MAEVTAICTGGGMDQNRLHTAPTPASTGRDDGRRKEGPITEAGCWAHARRKYFDLARLDKAPIATGR
jgi:hypothetical protein